MAVVQDYSLDLEKLFDDEFKLIGQALSPHLHRPKEQAHPTLRHVPEVRVVDVNGSTQRLRNHVNRIRSGAYWRKTKLDEDPIPDKAMDDLQLWKEYSRLMHIVVKAYKDVPPHTQVPLHWIILRDKRDFVSGNWNVFYREWLPYVDFMPEQLKQPVLNTLEYGVDITRESKHYTAKAPTFYRQKHKRLMSIGVEDPSYHHAYAKRQKFDTTQISDTEPIAYRPILVKNYEPDKFDVDQPGIFPTHDKHLECQQTIGDQLKKWLYTGAVQYVGTWDEWAESRLLKYYANTILPFSVERGKPRVCVDGGAHKAVAPDKIDCKLDAITEVLRTAKKGAWFVKTDDASGFMNVHLNQWSASLCGIKLGNSVFRCTALPFGLNDRIMVFNYPEVKIKPNCTFVGAALLAVMLTGFGGFVNHEKSAFRPVKQIDFLGFDLDSEKELISVPEVKYTKTLKLIDDFLDGEYIDVKLLERIRGKLTSWLICIPICRLMIREQTDVIAKSTSKNRMFWNWDELPNSRIKDELKAWKRLTLMELSRPWRQDKHSIFKYRRGRLQALYTDASQFGLGAKLFDSDNVEEMKKCEPDCRKCKSARKQICRNVISQPDSSSLIAERFFQYAIIDEDEPIHLKEMATVLKAIVSLKDHLRNKHLSIYIDNMSVVETFNQMGARDLRLSRLLLQILTWCHDLNIKLNILWIGTKLQLADGISRSLSLAECKLRPQMRRLITDIFNPSLDLFASAQNRLSSRIKFCSQYDELENAQTNGLSYTPSDGDVIYCYPPWRLRQQAVTSVLQYAKKAILVLPIFDKVTPEYSFILPHFSHIIRIGLENRMMIRPTEHKIEIDGHADYFCVSKTNAVIDCWLLLKGFDNAALKEFQSRAQKYEWGHTRIPSRRFDHFCPVSIPFSAHEINKF